MAHTYSNPLKIAVKRLPDPKFSSPAARFKGLRLGASPESATLAVTIIPVSLAVSGSGYPGSGTHTVGRVKSYCLIVLLTPSV